MPPLCTQFRMSTFSPWTNSGRSALRCLSADSRPVRDRATLHVSCLICGVRRAGWYLPSCARRRLAHCCGPGSLKLLPCRGNPFVDLVVTLLQILAGAKRRWRHRPLDYSCRGGLVRGEGGAESLAVSDVIYSETSIKHSTAGAPAIEIVKKDGMIQESGLGQHWCSIAQAKADPTRCCRLVHHGADPQRRVGDASEILPEYKPY